MFAFGTVRVGFLLFLLDCSLTDSFLPLQNPARVDFTLLPVGLAWLGLPVLALDTATIDLSMPLQQFSHPGLPVLAAGVF
jgi:hypothetical protein